MIIERNGEKFFIRDFPAEAKELGLPETASREEIDTEKHRRYWAAELGLKADANWFEIIDAKVKRGRIELARELGLPETSTWTEIENYKSSLRTALGLPQHADWWEINQVKKKAR